MISGYLAILATLLLWSGFFLSLKGGANSALTPADIALARFIFPALVLLLWVMKAHQRLLAVPRRYHFGMLVGCGLPYLLVASTAMQYAPVAHGSALIPGTLPLFVSAIAVSCYAQPLSRHRLAGLTLVLSGIGLFLYSSLSTYNYAQLNGHMLFLLGSLMWAMFTISARVANLHPLVSAGYISLVSAGALLVLIVSGRLDSHLAQTALVNWPWKEVSGHILLQGVGAGLLAAFTYLHAITKLGAERSAAFASATPAVATLLAIPVFGEVPTPETWTALGLICGGSVIASNVFMRNDTSLVYQPPGR